MFSLLATLPAAEMLDPSAINDEQWECVLVQMSGAVSGITANFGEWNLSDGVGQGMAASLGYNAVNDSILVDGVNVAGGSWIELPRDRPQLLQLRQLEGLPSRLS